MSIAPAEPGTTDPATPPADPATPPADPATPPAGDPPADPAGDGAADPRVTRANSEAARYRTERNALQTQVQEAQAAQQTMLDNIAKALGFKADEAADPAAQVGTLTGQVETLTNRAVQLEAELLVHTLAADPATAANPVKLLDSRSFTTALYGLDPSADDYRTKVADAIKTAVENDANLKAGGGQVPPSRGGAPEAGQGAGDEAGAVTQEQFDAMSYGEKANLHRTNPALYARLSGRA